MREIHSNYKILITMPSGTVIAHKVFATTLWHAIDKAYSEYADKQPDRSKYKRK